jgi:SAM-dependent methyltransferase
MNRIGPEVVHNDRAVRRLFSEIGVDRKDVFYDLGCGQGRLCIIAALEFHAKRSVGFELNKTRFNKAKSIVRKLSLSDRVEVTRKDFWKSDLREATVLYHGLTETEEDLSEYEAKIQKNAKLITLNLPLVGVLASENHYPFYVMSLPFRKTRSAPRWIENVLGKKASVDDFFEELRRDKDFWEDKRNLKSLMRKRFDSFEKK